MISLFRHCNKCNRFMIIPKYSMRDIGFKTHWQYYCKKCVYDIMGNEAMEKLEEEEAKKE